MKPFLQEVAEDLTQKFGENLKHCALVFNNKRPAAYLQKHLANIYQKPFWGPAFFTVQEFLAKSSSLKIADQYTQFFTLHHIYNELLLKEGFNAIETAKFYPIAKIILGDFMQIDYDLVDANKLFNELEDISKINLQFDYLTEEQQQFLAQFWTSYSEGKHKKQQELFIKMWRRMPLLYQMFHARLKQNGYISTGMLYRLAGEGKIDYPEFINDFDKGKVVFIGFNALSNAEAKAFKRWQEEGKALFYFDTDAYYLNDPMQEAGLFLRKNIDKIGLKNVLDNNREFINAQTREVSVYKVQGQTVQAKILNQMITEELNHPEKATSTAIVLADESLLIPVLQTIPAENENGQEIPLNVTMGYPLASSTVYGLADLWLNIQKYLDKNKSETIAFKDVEAFLSHPLTGISEQMRTKIRNVLIKEQLVEVPVERLLRQKGLFEIFFTPVNKATDIIGHLLEIFKSVLQRQLAAKSLKKIESELCLKTIQELNRLDDNLTEHLEKFIKKEEIGFVFSLVQRALQGISVPLAGDPLEGLQVMGLLETRNLNFDKIIVLGLNEGIVPKTAASTSFIPDSLRRVYGLPVLENQDAISAYMLYRLIQRGEDINFVYNNQTDESNSGEPSRFIKQLEYESGFTFRYFNQQLKVKTEKHKAVEIVKDEIIMSVLNNYLSGEKALSASALTTYISNPIDFFYKYIANIEEPEEVAESVEANQIGSILHLVMEIFYGELRDKNPLITKERIEGKQKEIPELIEKCFAQVIFDNENHQVKHSGMQKVVLAIVAQYVQIILDYDKEKSPFTIVEMEQKSKIAFQFMDAKGNQKSINLFGIIDRVDKKEGITQIVDYKSGSDVLKYKSIEEAFNTQGKSLNKALVQTLFYTHVYEQASGEQNVEPQLYVIKTMNKEGVCFKCGKEELSGVKLQEEKELFLTCLADKLAELFDQDIPFYSSENIDNFRFSKYMTLM